MTAPLNKAGQGASMRFEVSRREAKRRARNEAPLSPAEALLAWEGRRAQIEGRLSEAHAIAMTARANARKLRAVLADHHRFKPKGTST